MFLNVGTDPNQIWIRKYKNYWSCVSGMWPKKIVLERSVAVGDPGPEPGYISNMEFIN